MEKEEELYEELLNDLKERFNKLSIEFDRENIEWDEIFDMVSFF